ncbi:MAG: acyl-CoA thioesterase [Bacteriovoracaceae bacterium]|nr:acyl-CoA thioesterase [Bacteriovoracaceae bacterium]
MSEKKFEIFRYPLMIKESHLDTFGHMNNAAYLQVLEEARWEFITSKGMGVKTIQETGKGPTILEINLRFVKELRLRQSVVIETETLAVERKITYLRQTILNEENQVCLEAKLTLGLFDIRERKLIQPTPDWLRAIGQING